MACDPVIQPAPIWGRSDAREYDEFLRQVRRAIGCLLDGTTGIAQAKFLTLAVHAGLDNERVFTPSSNFVAVDNGAGLTYTLDLAPGVVTTTGTGGTTVLTLAATYLNGSTAAHQTISLLDSDGGKVIFDGTTGTFTGVQAWTVKTRETGVDAEAATRYAASFEHTTAAPTGAPLAGFGVGMKFELNNSASALVQAAGIIARWNSPTAGAELGSLRLQVYDTAVSTGMDIYRGGFEIPTNASLAVSAASSMRFRYNGTNAQVSYSGAAYVDLGGAGGGAPIDAQYLVLAANATLTVERVFTPGTGLGAVDSGAGAAYTLNLANTAVAAGPYISGATFTVDAQGRLTAAANIMTTLGDITYGSASGIETRLAGNTTTALNVLTQTGDGLSSAAPVWQTLAGAGIVGGTGTATRVAFWATGTTLSSSANLYWDNVSFRLGIGNGAGTPANTLHLAETVAPSGAIDTMLRVDRVSTGAAGLAGDGTQVIWRASNSTPSLVDQGTMSASWTTATAASENSRLDFGIRGAGAAIASALALGTNSGVYPWLLGMPLGQLLLVGTAGALDGTGGPTGFVGFLADARTPNEIGYYNTDRIALKFTAVTGNNATDAHFASRIIVGDNGGLAYGVETAQAVIPGAQFEVRMAAGTGTQVPLLLFAGAAHTALTASTEYVDANFNMARTVQFATGALTTQRAVRFQAPTYAFVAASTITDALTVDVGPAPAAGTNATITRLVAFAAGGSVAAGPSSAASVYAAIGITAHTLTYTGITAISAGGPSTLGIDQLTITNASAMTVLQVNGLYVDTPLVAGSVTATSLFGLQLGGKAVTAGPTSAAGNYSSLRIGAHTVTYTTGTGVTTGFIATEFIGRLTVSGPLDAIHTNAASLYIQNSPLASGVTITNPYSIWVDDGVTRFDGTVQLGMLSAVTGLLSFQHASSALYTRFQAGVATASVTYTLPLADATASGYALTSNAAGTLSWSPTTPIYVAKLGTNHAISSTTATEVTGLQVSLTAGTYTFKYSLICQSATTTVGLLFGVNYTGIASPFVVTLRDVSNSTTDATGIPHTDVLGGRIVEGGIRITESTTAPNLGITGVNAINANFLVIIEGVMVVSDSGDLELWHSSETATSTTVMTGSAVVVTKIA